MTPIKKVGRPAKKIAEKQFFGICCTPEERFQVERMLNRERIRYGRMSVSEFFLRAVGVRY